MRSRKLNQILADLHAPKSDPSHGGRPEPGHRDELEKQLLSRHRQLYPRKAGWKMLINPRWRTGRLVLASSALLVLGIAACTIPTEYEAEVGKNVSIHVPAGAGDLPAVGEMVEFLESTGVADEVSVSISEQSDGSADVWVMAWGQKVSRDDLINRMREQYPVLNRSLFEVQEMAGTVRGSLAQKLGHEVFEIEVHADTIEEIRAQFLQQLAEQGFVGDANIHMHDEGDERVINIELNGEIEVDGEGSGGAAQTIETQIEQ